MTTQTIPVPAGGTDKAQTPEKVQTLQPAGETSLLVLDKATLEALGLAPGASVSVKIEGRRLIVEPVPAADDEADFRAAVRRAHEMFGETFKRLAE